MNLGIVPGMRSVIFVASVGLVIASGACDPNAKANNKGDPAAMRAQKSQVMETCGTSLHCAAGLRCLEGVCTGQSRSVVGDYWAAAGRLALAQKDPPAAVKAYAEAVGQYTADKKEPPVSLYCEQGHALAAARKDPASAELGAKVLHHRCLNRAPVGSRWRRQALDDLAMLGESGLDPKLLAGMGAADRYMIGAAKAPKADGVTVAVSSNVRKAAKNLQLLTDMIKAPEKKGQFVACWSAHYKTTKQDKLVVALSMRSSFRQGQFEEDDGYRVSFDKGAPPAGVGAAGYACVKSIVGPLLKQIGRKGGTSWKGTVTVTLSE